MFAAIEQPPFRTYSDILTEVQDRLVKFTSALDLPSQSNLGRIGVVASCRLELTNLPPGISRFITFLGRPWRESLDEGRIHLRIPLSNHQRGRDRCHHIVSFNRDSDLGLLELKLDWQRCFEPSIRVDASLEKELSTSTANAVSYFETFGRGDLAYVD